MTIEEQRRYLYENLELIPLTSSEDNIAHIKSFTAVEKGEEIARYLHESAWDDDTERNTKVYLIKDKKTSEIVFYFAINCGILFSDKKFRDVRTEEMDVFNQYVEALKASKKKEVTLSERQVTDEWLAKALGDLWEVVDDEYRVSELIAYAGDKVSIIRDREEQFNDTEELIHTIDVENTFPAIDIKFFGKNGSYKPQIDLSFSIGIYVFWDILVPRLLEIADKVGCKYIYLFAADNSEEVDDVKAKPTLGWNCDLIEDNEVDINSGNRIRRLVNYYISELKFEYVSNYKVLKPDYESACYTLVQKVSELEKNREMVWASHSDRE